MRMLSTSLGSWDTIETGQQHKHGITFPLAIVHAIIAEAGLPEPLCWEGDERPAVTAADLDVVLVSAMDPRHFWRVPKFLDALGLARRADARGPSDPIVVMGGQAATAPAPVEHLVDVVYVGEFEARGLALMAALARLDLPRRERLELIAAIPGCLVPSMRPAGHVVAQQFSEDIGITLRERLFVNHRKIHRVEIARGCQSMCGFCVLGWRSKYRENDADAIANSLRATRAAGIREVHLSAGDAEAHSGIAHLRALVAETGLRDHGWTGRLDTMQDCSVSAGKQFAFGIEGPSHRLRKIAGKPKLTDKYILDEMEAYWQAGGRRAMWHTMGGLPGETDADGEALAELLDQLATRTPAERVHLEIGRQPFGPLPHTPMQWFAPGISTERIGRAVARHVNGQRLAVVDKAGQAAADALVNAVVMRGGPEVQHVVDAGPPRLHRDERIARGQAVRWMRGAGLDPDRYLGAWDPDAPTPWDHIQSAFARESVRRAYDRLARMVAGG